MEQSADKNFLIAYLAGRDVPCPLCAYNLRGLTSPRCPECGQVVQLSISLVEPFLKAWIALIVALLPAAGFGAIFIFGFCYAFTRSGLHVSDLSHIPLKEVYLLVHAVACVPLSVSAIAMRRRFLRLHRRVQTATAVVAWGLLLTSVLLVCSGMF